jgi:cytoskeletal protein CcmA (bactofilin family)
MFAKKKQAPIKSLIAQGTRLEGHVQFDDGLRLDGEVVGNVTASTVRASLLVISEHAVIDGGVTADHVIINGRVNGPVRARQLLELQPKARVYGDVSYQGLEMHLGALVHGTLMPEPVVAAAPADAASEPAGEPTGEAIAPQAALTNEQIGNS